MTLGAGLVGLLLANHAGLSDRAFRVAVRMAHTALDAPNSKGQPAGVYFAGWELLAQTLGREVPSPCSVRSCRCAVCDAGGRCVGRDGQPRRSCRCEACTVRERLAETVRRAIDELVKAGVVERLGAAHRKSRQAYRLSLTESPTATVPLDPTATVPLFHGKPHRHGGESPTATVPPRKNKEPGAQDIAQDTSDHLPAPATERARCGTARTPSRTTSSTAGDAAYARATARDRAAAGAGEVGVEWAHGGHPFTPSSRRPSASGHRLCVCGEPADAERHREVG
jgi:hypothetical protein